MNRLKVFDRALLGKQIAGNGMIVIIDINCLIVGVFWGLMELKVLISFILITNILGTCILYHSFILSQGDMGMELNTKKIIYYPTTRYQYLLNKYAKTIIFLLIQLILTLACLGLGYFGNRGNMETERVVISLLTVTISILLTSGTAILVMHAMPLGIYLPMILLIPLISLTGRIQELSEQNQYFHEHIGVVSALIIMITAVLWGVLLWIGVKIYEKV